MRPIQSTSCSVLRNKTRLQQPRTSRNPLRAKCRTNPQNPTRRRKKKERESKKERKKFLTKAAPQFNSPFCAPPTRGVRAIRSANSERVRISLLFTISPRFQKKRTLTRTDFGPAASSQFAYLSGNAAPSRGIGIEPN